MNDTPSSRAPRAPSLAPRSSRPEQTEAFPPSERAPQSGASQTVGAMLRQRRDQKRMSLAEVSRVTRIPVPSLEAIERDHFDDLPGEVFVRGFLKAYAQALGLSQEDVLARYTAGRRVATVTPIPAQLSVQPPKDGSSGRRFGVAIAFVLLLILFTLALSIVLRPRGRDIPPELSSVDAPSAPAHVARG